MYEQTITNLGSRVSELECYFLLVRRWRTLHTIASSRLHGESINKQHYNNPYHKLLHPNCLILKRGERS
jgi:hypothetical protein